MAGGVELKAPLAIILILLGIIVFLQPAIIVSVAPSLL